MALGIDSIGQVAQETADLLQSIAQLQQSGRTDKTDKIEKQAHLLIDEVEKMVAGAASGGQGRTDELLQALKAQENTLNTFLETGQATLTEQVDLVGRLKDLKIKRGTLLLGRTLDWDRLITVDELQLFRQALARASAEVKRRRKLATLTRSILNVFSISLGLASKLAAL